MNGKTQIADMTAMEMLRAFRRKELSPVEAAEACLARIETYNPVVNAFCLVDRDTTLEAARESEARWQKGAPLGRVDGVPTAIKDVFMTRGWFNRKASHVIPDDPATDDAPAIAALRREGFVPMGKVTTPEFGWKGITDSPLCGITRNPWDPDKTPGGSSGGSSAAVALGMAPLSLGTDAGGSIRIPAGFTGIFGLKPTQGRCPIWPQSPFGALAHPGPMTWTVEDSALLMNIIASPDPHDTTLPETNEDYLVGLYGGVAGMRIAGGSVISALPGRASRSCPALIPLEENGEQRDVQFSRLKRRWLPGFTLVSRDDLLVRRLEEIRELNPDANELDAWLDLSRLNHECHLKPVESAQGEIHDEVSWEIRRPPGWIVPIPIGYDALTEVFEPGAVANSRDAETPFRFVESLYSIGQWISPHRLQRPEELLWYVANDLDAGLYRLNNDFCDRSTTE